MKWTSGMRAELSRYATAATKVAAVKRYQLTYPTISKQFINSKRPLKGKRRDKQRSDSFEIKKTLKTQVTVRKYHRQNYLNHQGFTFERSCCEQYCH